MENKVIIVDKANLGDKLKILRILMLIFVLFAVPAFVLGKLPIDLLGQIIVSIIADMVLLAFFLIAYMSKFKGLYFANKIEYNNEEIIVHRPIGKVKFRFDEKPVNVGRLQFERALLFHIVGIRRAGFSFTSVMIPENVDNLDEIVALFKRIGHQ